MLPFVRDLSSSLSSMKSHAEKDTVELPARSQVRFGLLSLVIAAIGLATCAPFMERPTLAQESTPVPVTCDADPRPVDFLVALLDQPAPEVTPEPLTGLPDGSDDVDIETKEAVTAVVAELIACVNEGQLLRAFALYDDEYLRRLIDPEGLMTEAVAAELLTSLATPEPSSEDDITSVDSVLLVRRLPDGSVALVVQSRGGVGRGDDDVQADLFLLRQVNGKWLIADGLADIDLESVPAS